MRPLHGVRVPGAAFDLRGRRSTPVALLIVTVQLAFLAGCGYALVGRGTVIDPSIKRIGVPLFRDATGKPTLDQQVTRKVIEELLKRGRFAVVQQADGVDAVLDGEITGYRPQPVAIGEGSGATPAQASRYALVLSARIRFSKVGAAEPIWSSDNYTYREEYDVGSSPDAFLDREEQAIERLTTAFARKMVADMLEAF